jgi:hypothetical protein
MLFAGGLYADQQARDDSGVVCITPRFGMRIRKSTYSLAHGEVF